MVDHPVSRGYDGGVEEIEFGLLDLGERLAELRIVRALRPEFLLGALEFGLGLSNAGLGGLDLRRGLVGASLGVGAFLNKLEDTCNLLARVVALCCCRNQTFLRRANRRGARAY